MLQDFNKHPRVESPDRKSSIKIGRDWSFYVVRNEKTLRRIYLSEISSNIEIGWSPDSSQFFISYSDGGAIGSFHVRLYQFRGDTVVESRVPEIVAKAFRARHWCESRGNNLSFLDWTPDSKVAFLVAQVYPTGDCGEQFGLFRGYAVDLKSERILRLYGETQTDAIERSCRKSRSLVLEIPSR